MTLMGQMILNMSKSLKGYALFLCLCALLALLGIFSLPTVVTMTILLLIMLPVGGISPDTEQKDPAFPRRAAVTARYLLVLLMALAGAAFGLSSGIFIAIIGAGDAPSALDTALLSLSVGLFVAGVLMPLNYHFGTQRTRRYLYPIVIIPMTLLLWQERHGAPPTLLSTGRLTILSLLGLGISCLISCRTAEKTPK